MDPVPAARSPSTVHPLPAHGWGMPECDSLGLWCFITPLHPGSSGTCRLPTPKPPFLGLFFPRVTLDPMARKVPQALQGNP